MNTYPPIGFYFSLTFGLEDRDSENGFQEVSGISVTLPTEEIQEGGLNKYKHKVPGIPTYTNLVLKRGFVAKDSELAAWFKATINSDFAKPINPKTIVVMLLDEKGSPLKTWTFTNAWPVKWSISDFDAQGNTIAIESLEFAYSWFDI